LGNFNGASAEFIIWGGLRLWYVPTSYRCFIHKQVAAVCAEQCHPHWTGSLATTRHKKWFRFPGIETSTNCFLSFSLVRPSTKRCEDLLFQGLDHIHPREDGTQGAGSSGTTGGALREEWCGEEGGRAEEDAVVVL
jgi:hypothetical protein